MKKQLYLFYNSFCLLAFTYGLVNLIINPLTFRNEVLQTGVQLRDELSIQYLGAYIFILFVTFTIFITFNILIKFRKRGRE